MTLEIVNGKGICAAGGFRAAGVAAGIKSTGALDLALLVSDAPAAVAGIFTTSSTAAAPVRVSREKASRGTARGVVANSGCANACTGPQGHLDAVAMAAEAARLAGVPEDQMLVCSTGLIGSHLPMDAVRGGIKAAVEELGSDDETAARAIMTSDSRPKKAAVSHRAGWSLGGIAKGAGMIAPRMATMLAFITTDAEVEAAALQNALGAAVENSFNSITIDGDTSTNDTVLCFANGVSGVAPSAAGLASALGMVCGSLAAQIVADGEGATKFVRVRVRGAADAEDARRAARAVAESILVKTALYGGDANWGRVAAALGRSGARLDAGRLGIAIAGVNLLSEGLPAGPEFRAEARAAIAREHEIIIICDLYSGDASAEFLTTDLSEEFVRLNAAYE